MKGPLLLVVTAACLYAQQQGSIEGIAIHAVTHEPLSNVHVRLVAASFSGINGAYGAMSDRAGHFSIATIRPGTYILMPERTGFLHVHAKTPALPTISIKAGEHLTGYQLEMTPRAVLAGRVVDESGDPVQGVRVQALPANPDTAPVVLIPAPNPATDDRGEFRILTAGGKYYLQATSNVPGGGERPEVRSDGTTEAIYATTFYPSSVRKDRGTVVDAVAGKEVSGLEIRLARQQQGLSISGVVSGIPEGATRTTLVMQWGDKAPQITNGRSTSTAADGRFRFDGLQPGFYRVWAQYADGKTQLTSRMMEWTLENAEVSNVEFRLVPAMEVSGKVRFEGDAPAAPPGKRTVNLEPVMGYVPFNTSRGGAVDADGMFRITGVAPGRYAVRVEPLAENAYVKTLEIDGAAARGTLLDLSNAVKGVNANILIGRNAVQISGNILDSNGERIQANVVLVYLVQEFAEILASGKGTTQPEADGRYTLKSVAPGKYKLFAVDAFQISGNAMETLREIFNRAEEVEFKEGGRITKDLKLMAKEDPNARPKK